MIYEDTPIALNEIQIFSGLTKQELRSVNRLMATVDVKAGHHLARQGEKGREFMVIKQGEATVPLFDAIETPFGKVTAMVNLSL